MPWATRGKPHPHTPEWEKRRLDASREAMRLHPPPKGYRRPKEHTQPMLDALNRKHAEEPERFKQLAIANLPKDCNGSKNGNWKGGITAKTRGIRSSNEYKHWREGVLVRDGRKCKLCAGTNKLQVHHIIPLSECPIIACLPMNGVTLCKECHYANDEAWKGKRYRRKASIGSPMVLGFTIPHKLQAYPTVGNWQYSKEGVLVLFVSQLSDHRYECLIFIHEMIEAICCKNDSITQAQVDNFDMKYEKNRPKYDDSEPGDDPKAPYHKQHCVATGIERILAAEFGIDWKTYEDQIDGLHHPMDAHE